MTRTCFPQSKARCSASVSADFGVIVLSRDGSSARERNIATLSRTPVSSKESMKYFATSYLTPIAANTIAKSDLPPRTLAWRTIWAASWLCSIPFPEKIGSFCPWIRVIMPSITEIPVWMKSLGYSRAVGFIGVPLTSRSSEDAGTAAPSRLFPSPFMTRPSIFSETPSVRGSPRKCIFVPGRESPSVPSKHCTHTASSEVSRT